MRIIEKYGRSPPVHEIEVSHIVEGQDGRVAWERSSSKLADTKEPFAWTIANDNKSIFGADIDGYFHITASLARPHREMLRAQRHRSFALSGSGLPCDGSRSTLGPIRLTWVGRCYYSVCRRQRWPRVAGALSDPVSLQVLLGAPRNLTGPTP